MTELLTAAQMRAIEQAAIESGEVTGLELMERAGQGVVEAIFEEWPELAKGPHKAVVLCGPGNNGGDGFVVARLLREKGWDLDLFLFGDPSGLPPDAKSNHDRWASSGPVLDIDRYPEDDWHYELYVDALFGTGLSRELDGKPRRILNNYTASPHHSDRLISVDVQSGLCADSGKVLGGHDVPYAAVTVAFHTPQPGLYLDHGPFTSAKVRVCDIGLSPPYRVGDQWMPRPETFGSHAGLMERPSGVDLYPLGKARFPAPAHKYHHGHALILSGPPGRTGAARLAARGALRIGAGLVTIGYPDEALLEISCNINSIMTCPNPDASAFAETLKDDRLNALCLGPALGLDDHAKSLVETALKSGRATVVDADALTMFQAEPEALFSQLHKNCVLTPHEGEFKRLFPDIHAKLAEPATKGPAYSKVDAAREAAARAGCVVLFKGPDTVIADPKGRAAINSAHYEREAPWLATAGSGDVLAGFITGLLARGFAPRQAAATAAWLHVECALSFGPGLIAEDLPEELPKVFRKLGL